MRPSHETVLTLCDKRIQIYSEDVALENYLLECLWPYVELDHGIGIDFTLYAVNGSLSPQDLDYFYGQNTDELGINPVITNPVTRGQMISYRFRKIAILFNTSRGKLHEDVTRAIKQLLSLEFQKNGYFLFNAAAVALDNRAFLIVGPSGAGKTTLALAGVAQGASYIANDVALVKVRDGKWWVRGYPDVISSVQPGKSIKHQILLIDYFQRCTQKMSVEPVLVQDIVVPQIASGRDVLYCQELSLQEGQARVMERLHRDRRMSTRDEPDLSHGLRIHSLKFPYSEAASAFHLLQNCFAKEYT